MSFPKEGIPHPGLQDDGMVMVIITTSQKFNFPPGVTRAEVRVQGGGASSSGGATGNTSQNYAGNAGALGYSSIPVEPNFDYFAVIGGVSVAPGAASGSSGTAGNDTLFTGPSLAMLAQGGTVGNSNSQAVATGVQVSVPGGLSTSLGAQNFLMGGTSAYGGGGRIGPAANSAVAYGSGAAPPSISANSGLAGNNGPAGVIEIRYKGKV